MRSAGLGCVMFLATCVMMALGADGAPPRYALSAASTAAENPDPARSKEYDWKARHEAVKVEAAKGDAEVVFIGDSITHYFGGRPVAKYVRGGDVWKQHFERRKTLNLGFGWDRTQHVIWRIHNGELDGLSPKLAILLIGVNNMGHNSNEEIAGGVEQILALLDEKTPKAKVLLLGVLPHGQKPGPVRDQTVALNGLLKELADGKRVHFLDVGALFLSADGSISREVMKDFLHPTAAGYAILADAMEPKMKELLGEPGE